MNERGEEIAEDAPAVHGGCHCGAVRYVITGPLVDSRVCHCHGCQKLTGSAFFPRALVRRRHLEIRGTTTAYASSDDLMRYFCPTCGSLLFADRRSSPKGVAVSLGTLDDHRVFPPDSHIWFAFKAPWLELCDGLPKHDRAGD